MNILTDCDTREHLLNTGEQLCLQRGFSGMGMTMLLTTAGVPKGSFYHYFASKEAFGVAMIKRYYQRYYAESLAHFQPSLAADEQILAWYQRALDQFLAAGMVTHCLAVKLSAEVCDLSEEMRCSLQAGSRQIIDLLSTAVARGQKQGCISEQLCPHAFAVTLHTLWLGSHLQAKISRNAEPLECALRHVQSLFNRPGSVLSGAF